LEFEEAFGGELAVGMMGEGGWERVEGWFTFFWGLWERVGHYADVAKITGFEDWKGIAWKVSGGK
jgi:hypothetical protein